MSGPRVSRLAAGAIVLLWGGILLIAAVERRLPVEQQWYGHAVVHLWTVGIAAIIAAKGVTGLRAGRFPDGPLRPLVGMAAILATIVAITGSLDAVGAYPTFRAFHDTVNAVAAPVGWMLLASLLAIVAAGLSARSGSPRPVER